MCQAVIFDADGTLIDSTAMWLTAAEDYLRTQGIVPEAHLGERLFSYTLEEACLYLKRTYDIALTPETLVQGIYAAVTRYYRTQVQSKPGILQLLAHLAARGIPMAVATATQRDAIEVALRRTGLHAYFQHIVTCPEVGQGKDRPDVYLAALDKLGSKMENTWVFEDALHGARTAKQAGFPVVGVYDRVSRGARAEMTALCDLYLDEPCDYTRFLRMTEIDKI